MLEWAPRSRETKERPGTAIGDFVLAEDKKSLVCIEPAGASMLLTFLDSHDDPLPGSPVELTQDFEASVGSLTIVGHSAPVLNQCIAEDEAHDGLLRVFMVLGSTTAKFFQYVRTEARLDMGPAGGGVLTDGTAWRVDGGSPYGGAFTSSGLTATWMFDGPGTRPGFDPFSGVMRLATSEDGAPADTLPDDAEFTLLHEFETLPDGNGTVLGSILWGYTLTWTLSGGQRAGPVPVSVSPVWRPPATEEPTRENPLGTWWARRSADA